MKSLIIILFLFSCSYVVSAQEAAHKRMPLFVSHLSAENKALLRRKGAPQYSIFTKVICFKKMCRGYIGWRTNQRNTRFKGFKDGGKIPRSNKKQPETFIKKDTIPANIISPPIQVDTTHVIKEQIFVFDEVLFDINSAQLNTCLTYRLDSLVKILKNDNTIKVKITGYTDNKGGESYNLKLSKDRAGSVAAYLVKQQIRQPRISFDGLGSKKPIANNKTTEGRRKNRRVENNFI